MGAGSLLGTGSRGAGRAGALLARACPTASREGAGESRAEGGSPQPGVLVCSGPRLAVLVRNPFLTKTTFTQSPACFPLR